jgi:hypothetical protein
MIEKINKRLNEYLGFDNKELYIDSLVRIFGGAIRDSIADQEIHDVDILCGSNSIKLVEQVLIKNGYKFMPKFSTIDIVTLYSNINVISEPKTLIKGDSIVQLIRPRLIINVLKEDGTSNFGIYEDKYIENFKELIKNVDLSCCGISFSNNILYQNYENAIIHCLNKVFVVNNYAKMCSYERCVNRTHKMMERGWEKVELNTTEKRDLKLDFLLNPISFEFTNEF